MLLFFSAYGNFECFMFSEAMWSGMKRLLQEIGKVLRRWLALFKPEQLVKLERRLGAPERKALEPPKIRQISTMAQTSVLGDVKHGFNKLLVWITCCRRSGGHISSVNLIHMMKTEGMFLLWIKCRCFNFPLSAVFLWIVGKLNEWFYAIGIPWSI